MNDKIKVFESEYLIYELMPNSNLEFVLKEFNHIEQLVKNESEWESYPEWLEYLSNRPIGKKPNNNNFNDTDFICLIRDNNLIKIENIEIVADESGIFATNILDSEIYGNKQFCIIFSSNDNFVSDISIIPFEQEKMITLDEIKNKIRFILEKYNLIFVDWSERKVI